MRRGGAWALGLVAALAAAGCGKKGPPLAPFVRIPAGVEKITAARMGSEVYVTLTVPTTNIDTSVPVDIARIDVYGYTGRVAPTPARWPVLGAVVASIPVVPPVAGADDRPLPQVPTDKGAIAGAPVTIVDPLTAEDLVQGPLPILDPRVAALAPPEPATAAPLKRFYIAIGFSQRGRPGPSGAQAELTLTNVPDAPADLRVTPAPTAVSLTWEPSGGLIGFLLDRALPPEPPPYDSVLPAVGATSPVVNAGVPAGPTTYNVYRQLALDPLQLPIAAPSVWSVPPPVSLNVVAAVCSAGRRVSARAARRSCRSPVGGRHQPHLGAERRARFRRLPGLAPRSRRCHTASADRSADRRGQVSRHRGERRYALYLFGRGGGYAASAAERQRPVGSRGGNCPVGQPVVGSR